ncbi:hypothetical protein GWK47_051361 [Chionoecetes opilio]|uniref:Uncharacterized protein n=1 Tax=Chionoecetes opilio TaxID=41210 RepID=A0A8J4Y7H9_CHIOP|nr:hypothetical protein GWK47_051361 [Chionoecetes opilio]
MANSIFHNSMRVCGLLHKKSIKSSTRAARSAGVQHCKEHVITLTTPIPSRDVVLNVAHNKEQLIEMINEEILDRTQGLRLPNRLVVTGKADTPVEVWQGVRVERSDLQTNHEEADVIIPHQRKSLGVTSHLATSSSCCPPPVPRSLDPDCSFNHIVREASLPCITVPWNSMWCGDVEPFTDVQTCEVTLRVEPTTNTRPTASFTSSVTSWILLSVSGGTWPILSSVNGPYWLARESGTSTASPLDITVLVLRVATLGGFRNPARCGTPFTCALWNTTTTATSLRCSSESRGLAESGYAGGSEASTSRKTRRWLQSSLLVCEAAHDIQERAA